MRVGVVLELPDRDERRLARGIDQRLVGVGMSREVRRQLVVTVLMVDARVAALQSSVAAGAGAGVSSGSALAAGMASAAQAAPAANAPINGSPDMRHRWCHRDCSFVYGSTRVGFWAT